MVSAIAFFRRALSEHTASPCAKTVSRFGHAARGKLRTKKAAIESAALLILCCNVASRR